MFPKLARLNHEDGFIVYIRARDSSKKADKEKLFMIQPLKFLFQNFADGPDFDQYFASQVVKKDIIKKLNADDL